MEKVRRKKKEGRGPTQEPAEVAQPGKAKPPRNVALEGLRSLEFRCQCLHADTRLKAV
jgi:hypothetical protein